MQQLAGAREVADTTLTIPHPYVDGMAEAWIGTHVDAWERQERVTFAITSEADGVVGAITTFNSVRTELLIRRWPPARRPPALASSIRGAAAHLRVGDSTNRRRS